MAEVPLNGERLSCRSARRLSANGKGYGIRHRGYAFRPTSAETSHRPSLVRTERREVWGKHRKCG